MDATTLTKEQMQIEKVLLSHVHKKKIRICENRVLAIILAGFKSREFWMF